MNLTKILLDLVTEIYNVDFLKVVAENIVGSIPSLILTIPNIILKIPSVVLKIFNWKYRKIVDAVLVHKIKDETIKSFTKRILFKALEAFAPIISIFVTSGILICKSKTYEMLYSIGKMEGVIWATLIISFVLMYIVQLYNKVENYKYRKGKWLIVLIHIDLLIFIAMILSNIRSDDVWWIYYVTNTFVLLAFSPIIKRSYFSKYDVQCLKISKSIRLLGLIVQPVLMFRAEEFFYKYFIWFWLLLWYFEYILNILGVGLKGKDVTIHFKDSETITKERILKAKDDIIIFTQKDETEVLIPDTEINYISYECEVLRTDIQQMVRVFLVNENKIKEYDTVTYFNDKWVALNKYEGKKKNVEIRKLRDVNLICQQKREENANKI